VVKACQALRDQLEAGGTTGDPSADATTQPDIENLADYARYSFGAQFAEAGSMSTRARSGFLACSASSRPGGSSIPSRPGLSSLAA
jgi:hypothetical protein